ncbi:MAG: hypothetical protein A2Z14_07045 [Chloroflexi bacterium RBG_16_48_8]|nr:MAG: hypothetical protein A2Z14_07045 [Chloroflexi bacterium RBG_16_48_8]
MRSVTIRANRCFQISSLGGLSVHAILSFIVIRRMANSACLVKGTREVAMIGIIDIRMRVAINARMASTATNVELAMDGLLKGIIINGEREVFSAGECQT